ncbi:MAG: hypothetical protein MJ123_05030 [Lachnospiraceae bacterium]|nr:hypothetical protein [Lachnospiraceae bacterium]
MNTQNLSHSELRILNNKRRRNRQLKRRISLFFTCMMLAMSFIIFHAASSSAKNINEKTLYKYYKSVQIQAGDTLDELAEEYMTDGKYTKNKYIKELMYINSLDKDSYLRAGSYIIVPYYDVYH